MSEVKVHFDYRIRTAQLADIPAILDLFAEEVKAGLMLPRSEAELRANIQDWRVAQIEDEIVGCVSLVFYNAALCEIRSLAVGKPYRQNGLGKKLVHTALEFANETGSKEVLTLTRSPWVFEAFGFKRGQIGDFPAKVQQDCQLCPFINQCDEIALLYTMEESEAQ